MIRPESAQINQGELEIGGLKATELVKQFGSPLYVVDEATVRRNCKAYTDTLKVHYPNSQVVFAGKAQLHVGLLNILAQENLGVDVVSGGELYTALKSKISKDKIIFHGNNKSIDELTMAINEGICVVVDNASETETLGKLAQTLGKTVNVLFRLKPEIEAHTHDYIKTGHIDSKFGIDKRELLDVLKLAQGFSSLNILGLHSHIGSQIFDIIPFEDLADIMVGHLCTIRTALGLTLPVLNLGGGWGIQYTEKDDPLAVSDYLIRMVNRLKQACDANHYPQPKLMLEPGRSIVGNAGVTLYTIGTVKVIPGVKQYVFIDGGMADNPRPMLYQSQYTYTLANKADQPHNETYAIAGKYCESGDVLTHSALLPKAQVGDVMAVFGTGAYNYSMASNYNRCCKPAVVAVNQGQARVLVRRETLDDLVRCDEIA